MRLPDDPTAVPEARRHVRCWAAQQGLSDEVVRQAELVTDELVCNAVRHAQPPFEIELSARNGAIRGEVADGSGSLPAPRPPDSQGGFGLVIVDATTSHWGVAPEPNGKKVWFEIDQTQWT